MTAKTWAILLCAGALLVSRETCRARAEGELRGEIKARGESIKQLGQLAAKQHIVYVKAKGAFIKTPTLETCREAFWSCEQIHATDSAHIAQLTDQNTAYKKLSKKGKLFGFLPRPTVQVGACFGASMKFEPCISGGFPILK